VIQEVNGQHVGSIGDISSILSGTRPGDRISLTVLPAEVVSNLPPAGPRPAGTTYTFNLTSAPDRSYGYMGVSYYNSDAIVTVMKSLPSPMGFLLLAYLPVDLLYNQVSPLHMLLVNTPDQAFYTTPSPPLWGVVHFLFWCGWFNLMVGTFNALPMVPFDGGFIMKEGVSGLLRRLGRPHLVDRIALVISLLILAMIVLIVTIPLMVSLITTMGP